MSRNMYSFPVLPFMQSFLGRCLLVITWRDELTELMQQMSCVRVSTNGAI